MNAATALDKQIERYRQMTGEQRLKIALDLHEMSCNIARAGIRRQHPGASKTEVEQFLHARLKLARAA
jgi:type II secretory pathway predicted ATPase ExeA